MLGICSCFISQIREHSGLITVHLRVDGTISLKKILYNKLHYGKEDFL